MRSFRWPSVSSYEWSYHWNWRGLPGIMFIIGMLMITFATYNLRRHPTIAGCPHLAVRGPAGTNNQYTAIREIQTLSEPWPDRTWGLQPSYPDVYSSRVVARERLGPIFWTIDNDLGRCFLTIVDEQLAERLFERDGTALSRTIDIIPQQPAAYTGIKFVTGADWSRQRAVLTQEVLTVPNKRALAEEAAPRAIKCMLRWVEQASRVSSRVDLLPMVRECIGRFFVDTVLGTHFARHDELVAKLMECERASCKHRHSMFDCLRGLVHIEALRRHAATSSDPDAGSLLSRMLKFVASEHRHSPGEFLSLSLDEASSNAISFMAAGWETAVVTMLNALWAVSSLTNGNQTQLAVQRLEKDKAEAFGMQIVSETLRWRPPVPWHAGNVAEDEMEIQLEQSGEQTSSSLLLGRGTRVLVDILGTHDLPSSGMEHGWDPQSSGVEHAGGIGARRCPGGMLGRWGVAWMLTSLLKKYQMVVTRKHSRERWLQAFSGDFDRDLCTSVFDSPLEVNVQEVDKQA